MTDPTGWQRIISEDARELLDRHAHEPLEPVDAYRLLVLLGRARQSGLHVTGAGEPVVSSLAASVSLPEQEELLSELHTALEAWAGPEQLHGLLLDVDDLVTVLELLGDGARARELARRATAHVAGEPQQVAPLAPWAEARLATLGSGSAAQLPWRQVARSRGSISGPLFRLDSRSHPHFPVRAAASPLPSSELLSDEGFELYESEGHWILWVRVESTAPAPHALELRLRSGEREGRWSYRVSHTEEGGFYVDLGTPGELRQRAASALGTLPGADESFELTAFPSMGETDDTSSFP